LIASLQIEKKHLQESLRENKELKDQYKEKCASLSDQLETMFKESQNFKRNLVGIEEIRQDRD